ncbi:MAG: preprotein translocase subunit SecE [Luteibaculaceae bacterium]
MSGIKESLKESYIELTEKVSWPTYKEVQSSAILVIVATIIISLIIFLMDYVFGVNSNDSWWRGILGHVYRVLNSF